MPAAPGVAGVLGGRGLVRGQCRSQFFQAAFDAVGPAVQVRSLNGVDFDPAGVAVEDGEDLGLRRVDQPLHSQYVGHEAEVGVSLWVGVQRPGVCPVLEAAVRRRHDPHGDGLAFSQFRVGRSVTRPDCDAAAGV